MKSIQVVVQLRSMNLYKFDRDFQAQSPNGGFTQKA